MDNKKFTDETTQIKVIKKGRKNIIKEEENEYQDLQKTREFKKVFIANGKVVDRYHPDIQFGLNDEQIEKRKKDGLTNRFKDKNKKTYLGIIVKNTFTFLNILLYAIAIVIIVWSKSMEDYMSLTFMGVIGANLLIGIVQECSAKRKIDKLSVLNKTTSTVIRNGIKYNIATDEIVLDDTLSLDNGQKITADAIVKEGHIEVNESLLTGESLPVKKNPGDPIYAGSFVSSGSCLARVERVGKEMYVSKLETNVKKLKKNNSQILTALNKIIRWISYIIIPLAIMLFFTMWFKKGWTTDESEVREIVMSVAGSMVAMIPSGLYLMVSVTLFVTMGKLAGEKSLVQDSYSVETLARVNTLCLDKTGTITDGTMVVESEVKYDDKLDSENIIANLVNAFPNKNQTAIALDKKYSITEQYVVEKTLPFSSKRKKSAATFKGVGSFVLGAPEFLLDPKDKLIKQLEKYTEQGYRVVMLCKVDDINEDDIVGNVVPVSAFIIKDHIRDTATATIRWFKENDVEVKIISGDNPLTVSAIAKEVGVENAENWVSLENMSLDEVEEAAKKYTVFGRVAPEQKASLIKSLKEMGRTVAMTGDGVNDILAMKQADCSIAMGSGSDASRNVAQLVLTDDNFANMPSIVKEGRRVINNVQSVASLFLMKTIFAIILTATTFYPFTTRNLMLFEIIAIGIPSVLLALQPNDSLVSGSFLKNVFKKCVPAGLAITITALVGMTLTGAFSPTGEGAFGLNTALFTIYNGETDIYLGNYITGVAVCVMGLFFLAYHCIPFNSYRGLTYGFMIVLFLIGTYLAPVLWHGFGFLGNYIYRFDWAAYVVVVISVAVGIGLYYPIRLLMKKIVESRSK